MAQTGYTPIKLYYSSTATNVPLAANLSNGELAINIADGKLFYKDSGGAVKVYGAIANYAAATTPLAGTEELAILQSGDTVKVSVANLTAGREISASGAIIGDPGTEGTGILLNGVNYTSTLKVSDIDGTNYAQTILHRHSTTLEPLIIGARSNSNTTGHAAVTAGQNVFTVYGSGWTGASGYQLFGSMSFTASAAGAISATSAPGKWEVRVTPNTSVTPAVALTIDQDKSATFEGNVSAPAYQLSAAGIITESGTSRLLSAVDNGKVIYCTNGGSITITCDTGLGAGFSCSIVQGGAGKVTIAPGTATLVSYSSLFSTIGQYSVVSLISPVANTFIASGNLGV